MPVQLTYPGVYVQEVSSGTHTVTAVPTAVTAFIGRTPKGPVEDAHTVFNFGEFEKFFGGLAYDYPLTYAVRDFFLNGGSQAIIVRRWLRSADADAAAKDAAQAKNEAKTAKAAANDAQKAADEVQADVDAALAEVQTTADDAKAKKEAHDTALQELATAKAKLDAAQATAKDAAKKVSSAKDANEKKTAQAALDTAKTEVETARTELEPKQTAANDTGAQAQLAADAAQAASEKLAALQADLDTASSAASDASDEADRRQASADQASNSMLEKAHIINGWATFSLSSAAAPAAAAGAPAPVPTSPLFFKAVNPGSWANDISITADNKGITPDVAQQFKKYGLVQSDLFNLTISYRNKVVEKFVCVTIVDRLNNPNHIGRVLEHESNYLQIDDSQPMPAAFIPAITEPLDPRRKPFPTLSMTLFKGLDSRPYAGSNDYLGEELDKSGIYALLDVDIFNILCIPPDQRVDQRGTDELAAVNAVAAEFCQEHRALLIAEPHPEWKSNAIKGAFEEIQPTDLGINGETARYAATYFPRVIMPDPEMNDRPASFSACGIMAGVMATTDLTRGVWKAPAGQNAGLAGVTDLEIKLTDDQNGILNQIGINCLRYFPVIGPVSWGDRTLRGADLLSDDYKYINVRRLTNFIEESLRRSSRWAVFEPNDERLWSSLRLNINAFMADLARQGAFYNYQVKCDASTTSAYDIERGIVNIHILFAPVKPAEFVVLTFEQTTAKAAA